MYSAAIGPPLESTALWQRWKRDYCWAAILLFKCRTPFVHSCRLSHGRLSGVPQASGLVARVRVEDVASGGATLGSGWSRRTNAGSSRDEALSAAAGGGWPILARVVLATERSGATARSHRCHLPTSDRGEAQGGLAPERARPAATLLARSLARSSLPSPAGTSSRARTLGAPLSPSALRAASVRRVPNAHSSCTIWIWVAINRRSARHPCERPVVAARSECRWLLARVTFSSSVAAAPRAEHGRRIDFTGRAARQKIPGRRHLSNRHRESRSSGCGPPHAPERSEGRRGARTGPRASASPSVRVARAAWATSSAGTDGS